MNNEKDRIDQLQTRLQALLARQDDFAREINHLRIEIANLRSLRREGPLRVEEERGRMPFAGDEQGRNESVPIPLAGHLKETNDPVSRASSSQPSVPGVRTDLEKFIGENLINKIGIAITVIGVGIGAKYAIDHELISPLARIILGYLVGLVLFGFAINLKRNYKSFSAVLLSGAMAVMYLISYAAYDYYELMPVAAAFVLMLIFTAFTVGAAIVYNLQAIAHIGLVGAYAVPFLLSGASGRTEVFYAYMSVINAGVLVIAFRKNWKPLFYVAFGLTWFIFLSWYTTSYVTDEHFVPGLIFLSVFFATFYIMFLAYKIVQREKYQVTDVVLLLINSFIFYGMGYGMLHKHPAGNQLLGLFTLFNALVHFGVSVVVLRRKKSEMDLLYFVSGLGLVFIILTIPVQLDGGWVTLLWAGEAALLYRTGRTKGVRIYEILSYPLMLLAFLSLMHDWMSVYQVYDPGHPETRIIPIININSLTSLLFISGFGYIYFLHEKKGFVSALVKYNDLSKLVSFVIPAILLFSVYYAFHLEIANYWNQLYKDSRMLEPGQGIERWAQDLRKYKTIWLYDYTFLFLTVTGFLNLRWLRSRQAAFISLGLTGITLLLFLVEGLYVLSELRESFLSSMSGELYRPGGLSIGIRYVSFIFLASSLFMVYKTLRGEFIRFELGAVFDFVLHACILWVTSSELINLMDLAGSAHPYQLGLSILWGSYSLVMVITGIIKNKRLLRIWAIGLFGVTLLKLFLFDIADLDTIAKTVVFVSLGVLLLVISFLYIKYRSIISDEATR